MQPTTHRARPVIALLGNLAVDRFPGEPARAGGAPYHAARAFAHLGVPGRIYARCARGDSEALLASVSAFWPEVDYVPGAATASFAISDEGRERQMEVLALGDSWLRDELPTLPCEAGWVHVAPLLRSDFPPATLAELGRGRHLSLDGQGLVRPGRLGELVLDADYDPELLAAVQVLKLSDEEAEVLGDLAALPVAELVVTHGPVGATVYYEGRREEIPARAIGGNHTGTGDVFSVSYLAARAGGLEPVAAARSATAVVASVLEEGR